MYTSSSKHFRNSKGFYCGYKSRSVTVPWRNWEWAKFTSWWEQHFLINCYWIRTVRYFRTNDVIKVATKSTCIHMFAQALLATVQEVPIRAALAVYHYCAVLSANGLLMGRDGAGRTQNGAGLASHFSMHAVERWRSLICRDCCLL